MSKRIEKLKSMTHFFLLMIIVMKSIKYYCYDNVILSVIASYNGDYHTTAMSLPTRHRRRGHNAIEPLTYIIISRDIRTST